MRTDAGENSLGRLVREIGERNVGHPSKYLLINRHGKRMTKGMLRLRWDKAREQAQQNAIEQGDPLLVGTDWRFSVPRHPAESRVGDRRYRGMLACCWDTANRRSQSGFTGGLAPPRNRPNRQSFGTPTRKFRNSCQKQKKPSQTPDTKKPRLIEALSFTLAGD